MGDADQLSEDLQSLAGIIDRLCDEFENGWRTGSRPRIEDYLPRVAPGQRASLFHELVGIEIHWRRHRQEQPDLVEYRQRFPDFVDVLEREIGTDVGDRVETLLDRAESASGFDVDSPRRFGGYELLSEIGRGGMGVVYRATQLSANRIVALKVIGRERLASLPEDRRVELLERFRTEAQAAARLRHDHLVTVYEVGEANGLPFFSMQFVEGTSLADLLRSGPLDNATAARHLESIARAVHEAHSHGILHRDLKPQNVMVEKKSDRALVVDFGLAKLLEQSESMTRSGEIVGTPSHMAPEQALDASRVSAQTDVYALGATLYHMLTARPPFQAATVLETLQQVKQAEPVAPRRLNPAIDRDLETICLKCLEKESTRRYLTAADLADDLQRYRQNEPIIARPVGVVGRSWRWSRRNPLTAISASVAGISLLLSIAVLFVAYRRQVAALQVTRAAHAQSDESFRDAVETVKRLCTRVSEDTLLNQPGMQPLRRDLLQDALRYFEKFLAQRQHDPGLRSDLAAAHFQIGLITEQLESPDKALRSYEQARTLQRQLVQENPRDAALQVALATSANRIGRALHQMQQLAPAVEAYREAIRIRAALAESEPSNRDYQLSLANSLMNAGLAAADEGDFAEAKGQFQRAQQVRQKLLTGNPHDDAVVRDLGQGFFNSAHLALRMEDPERLEKDLEQATRLFEQLVLTEPVVPDDLWRLAVCYRMSADLADQHATEDGTDRTVELYRKALQITERLVLLNPGVVPYQTLLAGIHINLGQVLIKRESTAEASKSFSEAVSLLKPVVERHSGLAAARRDLAVALTLTAEVHSLKGEKVAARANLTRAKDEFDRLIREFPENSDYAEQRDAAIKALAELGDSPTL